MKCFFQAASSARTRGFWMQSRPAHPGAGRRLSPMPFPPASTCLNLISELVAQKPVPRKAECKLFSTFFKEPFDPCLQWLTAPQGPSRPPLNHLTASKLKSKGGPPANDEGSNDKQIDDRCPRKSVICDPNICHQLCGFNTLSHSHTHPPFCGFGAEESERQRRAACAS